MTWKKLLPIGLLTLLILTGCSPAEEVPPAVEGDFMSGTLDKDEAGTYSPLIVSVEQAGDPVGIDFRGVLIVGSVRVELVDEDEQVVWQEQISTPAPFALNTVAKLEAAGDYTLRLAWDGPLQLQYALHWQPGAIEIPTVPPLALLPGIGMIAVAMGFMVYALVQRLGWGYIGLGAAGWLASVILQLAWASFTNASVYGALGQALPEEVVGLVFYLYASVLTGAFEVGLVWLVLRYTRLGQQVDWDHALAFGTGFGAAEALLVGALSVANVAVLMASPELFSLEELRQVAQTGNLLYSLAPISGRFLTALIHIGANVLIFYGMANRQPRWLWLAFAYKALFNIATVFGQIADIDALVKPWAIEAIFIAGGAAGWLIARWVKRHYPAQQIDAPSQQTGGPPPIIEQTDS